MAFKYSCFISYCSGQEELIQTFIDQLHKSISAEIEAHLRDYPVFLDKNRLKTGDNFNPKIASALCYSICMVAILTPSYYRQAYCLREYSAMECLEKDRFEIMGWDVNAGAGLIFPIVFRGPDRIPEIIKGKRQWVNFSKYTLCSPNLLEDTEFAEEIRKIAERILDFYDNFGEIGSDLCQGCENFELVAEDEVMELRERFKPAPKPFPFD